MNRTFKGPQGANVKRRKASPRKSITLKRLPGDFSWQLLNAVWTSLRNELPDEHAEPFIAALRGRDLGSLKVLADSWALQCSPSHEEGSHRIIAVKMLLTRLLSKNSDLGVAKSELHRACLDRTYDLDEHLVAPILNHTDDPVFAQCKRWLSRLLGEAPDVEQLNKLARHGPGSTSNISYDHRSVYFKYAEWPYQVTHGCLGLFKSLVTNDERWLGSLEQDYRKRHDLDSWNILNWDHFWSSVLEIRDSNHVTSVPKDWAKNRPIAKEPTGNIYCQLAVGSVMKDRLAKAGLDLRTQERNRELAKLASTWDHPLSPCTFDLSNASDTIHRDLVRALLPTDWFQLLDSVRSPYGEFPGRVSKLYAKMSSMGNATTFELESAIFYALIRAVEDLYGDPSDVANTAVFGDDLVFPRYLSDIVSTYLAWFGFEVNAQKSFDTGRFFESCGVDYYMGYNVRPVFLREHPTSVFDILSIRNRLHRWFTRVFGCQIPISIDEFLLGYVAGWEHIVGPEDNDCVDSHVHVPLPGLKVWRQHNVVRRKSRSSLPRDFWFGKLMHNLCSCEGESDGSRFCIARDGDWGLRLSVKVPSLGTTWYREGGVLQDHAWPRFEEISNRA